MCICKQLCQITALHVIIVSGAIQVLRSLLSVPAFLGVWTLRHKHLKLPRASVIAPSQYTLQQHLCKPHSTAFSCTNNQIHNSHSQFLTYHIEIMSDKLMDTEPGGEQTQYEGVHTFVEPHAKQTGQLGGAFLVSLPLSPNTRPRLFVYVLYYYH
jgi:hypothetical protein